MAKKKRTRKKPKGYGSLSEPKIAERFFATLAETGRWYESAKAAGVCYETVRRMKNSDKAFMARCEECIECYRDKVAAEIHRRAIDGIKEPVYYKGSIVGHIKRYSDRLLELEAKRRIPEYRDKVSVDANVQAGVLVVAAQGLSVAQWAERHGGPKQPLPEELAGDSQQSLLTDNGNGNGRHTERGS